VQAWSVCSSRSRGFLAPETWFPWVLVFAGWLVIWTGAAKLAQVSQSWTQASLQRIKSFLDSRWLYAVNVLLFRGVAALIRFAVFGSVDLQKTALDPALPGDEIKLTGNKFPIEHPKMLGASLKPKAHGGREREAINKGVAANVFTARLINGHKLIIDGGITAGWPAAVAREDLQRFRTRFRAEMKA
jgi:hypothetical protein